MIYELPIKQPIGSFKPFSEDVQEQKAILESIADFEKRLKHYNKEIRSLATFEKQGASIYYEWGLPDQKIKIYCNCNNCCLKPDFQKQHEIIYQNLRSKEIKRLVKNINSKTSYKEKLSFLFSTPGFYPHLTPAIWDDHKCQPIIDLRPESKEERPVFNQFVIDAFEKEYRNDNGFTERYNGFDFGKEKERLDKRLLNPVTDRPVVLQYIKTTIEKHFGYPENLQTDSRGKHINSNVLQQIDRQLQQLGHIPILFGRLCFGEEIDLLDITGLNNYSLLNYTHVSQIFKFYQYVKQLIESPEHFIKPNFPQSIQNIFRFIDFLYSKTDYLLSKQNLVDKVMKLHSKRNSLKPNENYKDRIEYKKVQVEFEKELDILAKETTDIIKGKIRELDIADISTPIINLTAHAELFELQRNFSEQDLAMIFEAKKKYVEFRTRTNFHYYLDFFFHDLDRDLKRFFDYFKEAAENDFEAFETKAIQVDNIGEVVEQFKNGNRNFALPIDFLNSPIGQHKNEPQSFQQSRPQSVSYNEKNDLQFEREFEKVDIRFKDVIEKELTFKNELKNQYYNAEKKPCFDLYLAEYYSQNEIIKGFEDIHKQIPVSKSKEISAANFVAQTPFESRINELHYQFISEVVKNELQPQYYCPDIERTVIVHTLRAIDNEYDILKKSVFDEKTDKYKETEIRADNIKELLARLGKFSVYISDYLKNDSDNTHLYIRNADKFQTDYWQVLKSNFNKELSKEDRNNIEFSSIKEKGEKELNPLFPGLKSERVVEKPETTDIVNVKNNFDSVSIHQIFAYFSKALVEKQYLSKEDLIKFLDFAFEKKEVPQTRFQLTHSPTKQKIMKIFYEYYKEVAGKPYRRQAQYAALLGDYFEGYTTENVRTNFNKGY